MSTPKTAKKSKYSAKKTIVDGIKFDSIKEGRRYTVLKLLEKSGHISDLKRQVKFELNEGGTFSYKYVADFTYMSDGKLVVDDCKGFLTREYKKKKKLMLKVHGIKIKET